MKFTFKKSERLSSKKVIDKLFDRKGSEKINSVFLYPFRVSYILSNTDVVLTETSAELIDDEANEEVLEVSSTENPQSPLPAILISVSKRYFKHAVDRNLIKRRTREAYRLNKQLLLEKPSSQIPAYIAFVYIAKTIEDYAKIEKSMKAIFKKMV
ncbi:MULTISPECIES: ribonuclease P protein component [unclassified Arcicella]|uniref:ribonuclease P protein component n=1 Tax=unclassified Arcicella TaxID=2644986 RepID=UPI00285E310D|nr:MULTISPECIES: ribonuclease P protein component [unclassified Arcicella]MDR6563708.1 ribonuclease P protein component [Arcicella sp. BE51]MDR6814770.1 ribonuclease P protein component [Arcicella sp. BE140]MDR6826226.1 ribonuclease P protein component [Arcicella sp. BE139]